LTPRLVLFDIDGTLIKTGRAGVRGMNAAFRHLHGREGALDGVTLAGRTDRAIVTEVFRTLGLDPASPAFDELRDAYVDHLREEITKPVEGSGVLPGVAASLDALEAHPHVVVGLLTGNFERGAAVKLGHFNLWQRFRFGAFGDVHADRRALVPVALEQAERTLGARIPASRVVVVGDTPADVDCAQAHGAIAVAVSTGPFTRVDLASHRPDLLLDTLEDVPSLLQLISGI
jgi:phosphoglycolate phosphatase-like HAD superfamily hydrolase